jgi:hypothetical protein
MNVKNILQQALSGIGVLFVAVGLSLGMVSPAFATVHCSVSFNCDVPLPEDCGGQCDTQLRCYCDLSYSSDGKIWYCDCYPD